MKLQSHFIKKTASFYQVFLRFFLRLLITFTPRSWGHSFKLTFLVIFIGLAFNWNLLRFNTSFIDLHSIFSAELAYNEIFCEKISYISPGLNATKLASILTSKSLEERNKHCAEAVISFQQNENSLRYIYAKIFTLFPQLTLYQLGLVLFIFRLLLFSSLIVILARAGLNGMSLFMVFSAYLFINFHLTKEYVFSLYPWLLPFISFFISSIYVNIDCKIYKDRWSHFFFFTGIGMLGGFLVNLRTSYGVIFIVIILTYLLVLFFTPSLVRKKLSFFCLTVSACVFGYFCFSEGIMRQYIVAHSDVHNLSYHVVAHPLVLSLGHDQSDLAKREGIIWLDDKGVEIARRVKPDAKLYDKDYESILFHYYCRLWKTYPFEMIKIYVKRFLKQETASSIKSARGLSFPNIIYLRPQFFINKIIFKFGILTHFLVILFMFLLFMHRDKLRPPFLFLMLALGCISETIMMESLIIFPLPSILYFSIPTFMGYFLVILLASPWLLRLQEWFIVFIKRRLHLRLSAI